MAILSKTPVPPRWGSICVFESISQGSASLHPGLSCGRTSGAWLIVLQTASNP